MAAIDYAVDYVRDAFIKLEARATNAEAKGTSPTLALSAPVVLPEGNTGATTSFVWTLTLTRNGSTNVVPYTWAVTGSGSSPADANDFGGTFPSGSGSFAAGETTKTITVLVAGDTTNEPTETFTLTVVPSLTLATVTSTGTITNDDTPPAAGTNLLTAPNNFETWQYNGLLSVTSDVAANPVSGVTNADRAAQSTGTSNPHNMTTPSAAQGTVTNGQTYTYAVDVKSETQQYVQFNMSTPINGGYANYDIVNGTVTASDTFTASVQDLGNGWKRIIATFLCYSTRAFVGAIALPVTATATRGQNELVANGNSKSLLLANAQLVTGSTPNAF